MRAQSSIAGLHLLTQRPFAVLGLILMFVTGAPAHAKKLLENVPLVWRPTTQIGSRGPVIEIHRDTRTHSETGDASSDTTGRLDIGGAKVQEMGRSGAVRVRIDALGDARKNPQLIGENREDADEGKILPVTTKDDVAAWCTDRLRYILEQLGFEVVEGEGDVILTGQVRRFFVAETNTYEGDVGLKIEVKSQDARVLWSGIANGVANRFGRSYKLENYYEVMSDSLLDAVQKLADHEGFVKAVGNGEQSMSDQ